MRSFPEGTIGFLLYTLTLAAAVLALPPMTLDPASKHFILVLGTLAIWRYSWGLLHFIRGMVYKNLVFPRYRRAAEVQEDTFMPSRIYLLITAFRIETETVAAVFHSAVREAVECGTECVIVASIVEAADEFLVKDIFRSAAPPERVRLQIVRIPGTGKRDGLAQGFRAISRDMPPPDSVVAVIDGDSILSSGLIRRTAVFFKMMPEIGALTTDEECRVEGSQVIREWHSLRFAQRQMLMSSMGLSKRVLTLTGRMSMFRGHIITDPDFIRQVQDDHLQHWRFGRLKFLTGDDKSSWYWLLKNGWAMLYVPDVQVFTVEHPPSSSFFRASTQLMFRWFGNMLRTNARALRVPPHISGFFTWWCLLDQRMSMWTALSGPVFAGFLCLQHGIGFLPVYAVWIALTRWMMAIMLLGARRKLHWMYPFLLYYNQIYGSLIKTFVLFRLDRQSWTRQKTKLDSGAGIWESRVRAYGSAAMHALAMSVFITAIGMLAGAVEF